MRYLVENTSKYCYSGVSPRPDVLYILCPSRFPHRTDCD